jgi:hypothetical protein
VLGLHLERVIRDQTMPVARLTRFDRRHGTQDELVLKEVGGEKRTGSSE